VSARAHASAAVGLLGQTCCRQPRRGDRAPQRFSAERESESKTGLGGVPLTGSFSDFATSPHERPWRSMRARVQRALPCPSSHVNRFTPSGGHVPASATNLLPSLSEAAAMAATLLPSHDTGHPSQIREFEPFHRSPPGRALCTSHPPGLRAAMVLCCLPRNRPRAPRMRGRLHPCLRALPPTPMTSTPARRSCTKISRRSHD
jgi:hypothetical protein